MKQRDEMGRKSRYAAGIIVCLTATGLLLAGPARALEDAGLACVTEPYRDATLSLPVTGRIEQLHVKPGDRVSRGERLVTLESTVEELEARRRKLIWQGKTELEAAEIQARTYRKLLDSMRELYQATKSVSKEELDKMELEYGKAEAERKRAVIAEQREKLEYELARANLERKRLTAPFAGTVVDIKLQEGESVEANQPLIQLVDVSKGRLVCNIEERLGRDVREGQKLPVRIQAGAGHWEGKGRVIFVSPVTDAASGLVKVELEFNNKSGVIRPGVSGYVYLPAGAPARP